MKYLFIITLLAFSVKGFAQHSKASKYKNSNSKNAPWSAKSKNDPHKLLGSGIVSIGAGGALIAGGIFSYNVNKYGEAKGVSQMRALSAAGGALCLVGAVMAGTAITRISKNNKLLANLKFQGNGITLVF